MILSSYVILFSCCHEVMLKGLVIFSRLAYTKYFLLNKVLLASFLGWVPNRHDKNVTHSRCNDIKKNSKLYK